MMKYNIEIETVRAGQPRPYADSVLEYKIIVSGDLPNDIDRIIEEFCTKSLTHCNTKYNDERMWCDSYYSFDSTTLDNGHKKYRFIVTSPYLD